MKYRTECNEVRAVLLGCLCLNDRVRRYADNALFPEERPRERGGVAVRCQVPAVRAREHGDIDPVVNKKPCAEGGCQFPDALRGLQELPCGERLFAELYYPHAAPPGSLYLFEERLPRGWWGGRPCASPFMKLPNLPNAWPSIRAGATASAILQNGTDFLLR